MESSKDWLDQTVRLLHKGIHRSDVDKIYQKQVKERLKGKYFHSNKI